MVRAFGNRDPLRPGGRLRRRVAPPRPAGQAAAREAVLPAAAGRGGPAAVRGGPADAGRGPGPARGARLRRPGRGAAAHRRADVRRVPPRGHPADAEAAVTAVRSVRRRELLRTSAADTLGEDAPGTGGRLAATGEALTDITRASLQAALAVALRKVSAELRRPPPTRFAVIAMGRF